MEEMEHVQRASTKELARTGAPRLGTDRGSRRGTHGACGLREGLGCQQGSKQRAAEERGDWNQDRAEGTGLRKSRDKGERGAELSAAGKWRERSKGQLGSASRLRL
jgi:hypothetical protein